VGRARFQSIDPLDEFHYSRLEAHDASLELDERQAQHRLDLALEPVNALLKAPHALVEALHALLDAANAVLEALDVLVEALNALHDLVLTFRKQLMPLSYDPDLSAQTFSDDVEVPLDLVHLVALHTDLRQGSLV
jgi:hypothetical protein